MKCHTVFSEFCFQQELNLGCCIATDKALFFIQKLLISFLFLNENICCEYSLEAPHRGASNEYPQHMFSLRNKKNIMWIPPLSVAMVRHYDESNLICRPFTILKGPFPEKKNQNVYCCCNWCFKVCKTLVT